MPDPRYWRDTHPENRLSDRCDLIVDEAADADGGIARLCSRFSGWVATSVRSSVMGA
jgi:hypothetical protein